MKVYLLRHGESEGNVARRFQTPVEKLTKLGETQAKLVAKRFTHTHIDRIVASTMTRAQQTAQAVAAVTGKEIISEPLFAEVKRPSVMLGKHHTDQNSKVINALVDAHAAEQDYHYSDEENWWDFIRRVEQALHSIERFESDEAIVVVAHGHVLRAILGLVLFGTDFGPLDFERFVKRAVSTNNTGVTMLDFTLEQGWQLITFNDHSHLLEE